MANSNIVGSQPNSNSVQNMNNNYLSTNNSEINVTTGPSDPVAIDPSVGMQSKLNEVNNMVSNMPASSNTKMNEQNQTQMDNGAVSSTIPQTGSSASTNNQSASVTTNTQNSPVQQQDAKVGANIEFDQNSQVQLGDPQIQPQYGDIDILNKKVNAVDIDSIFREAIKLNVSDVHLNTGNRVVVRINGELLSLESKNLTQEDLKNFATQLSSSREDINIEEMYEVDLSYTVDKRRFRINIYRQQGDISIAARLIPDKIRPLDELGLPLELSKLTRLPQGLVLLTGPTGSGKSTTIASFLELINRGMSKHIITLEDPIEFVYENGKSLIDQREYGVDFEDWNHALRATLRQDPDVVLLGEMRDYTTIASAVTTAETGHLVFGTLHTNSAAQSIDRMIDVFPDNQQAQIRLQLANVVSAVISQRLVQKADGSGRIAVAEVMIANSAIRASIREGKTHQLKNVMQTSSEEGMMTLEQALARLINNGMITEDVAYSTTPDPDQLELILNT